MCAFCGTMGRAPLPYELFAPSADLSPGLVGLVDCESILTNLTNKKAMAERSPVLRFLGIRRAKDSGEPDIVYSLPAPQNPAGGLTEVQSDRVSRDGEPFCFCNLFLRAPERFARFTGRIWQECRARE